MTHYQKLATMIFRIIGAVFLIFGGILAILALIFVFFESRITIPIVLFYSLPTIILGILFFSLSRKLAKLVCFDFNKFDE